MKIVHIQYRMPPAGNACFRLHTAMREYGIDSSVLTILPSNKRNDVYCIEDNVGLFLLKIINYLLSKNIGKKLVSGAYFYSQLPIFGAKVHKHPIVQEADVIYLHWIAGGCLHLKEIEKLAKTGKPVIMFMHDMWDFTGGCHHSFECDEYKTGCHTCYMFKNKNSKESHRHISKKRKLFSSYPNIVFVSPSAWMMNKAKESFALSKSEVYHISNVVDEKNFKPIDKEISKEILNLPKDKTIITFGCQAGTNNKFKGWDYLRKAIDLLDEPNVQIVVYGCDYNKETQDQVKYPITFLGPIFDETKLALVCNASDVFVSPSLAESFGLTFLENTLCGTPVVGFDNTAISEIVITGKNGYLAQNKKPEDLAEGISFVLHNFQRVTGRETYSSKDIINKHIEVIKQVLKNNHDDK